MSPYINDFVQGSLVLRPLQDSDKAAFDRAIDEIESEGSYMDFAFHYDAAKPFPEYVRRLDAWTRGEDLPGPFVPNTFLVGILGDRVVGRLSLRHVLNDYLRDFGGHVGYAVVPSERNKGYATQMLRSVFPIASALGISRMLITCDEGNAGSERVVIKSGGVWEDTRMEGSTGIAKKRFWIDLADRKDSIGLVLD
ncbi:MAG: GNAT family N-acetyltransferase [Fibrobacterota bacterium]|nr:MAG: GNAT family N-acetyltransferase [Fibrobacterota bacterium]